MAARAEEYPQASERYRVQINITMFQVDHEKLAEAGLMTLRRLTDETCVSINEPRAADDLFGVHTSTECAEKLVAALTAHEAVKLDTKRGLQSTFDIRPNDKALVSGFKYEPARLTLQLEAKLAHPANRGVLHVRLNVIGEQRPKKDLRTNADRGLEISSARKIGFASFLKAGQSLLIVDDSNNLESSVETDQVSLTIVSATSVTEIPVDQPQAVIAAAKNTSRDLSKAAIDTAIADAADRDADLKIERAEEEAIRAKDQYESSQNLVKKGLAKVSQAEADLLAWESAKLSLEAAKRRIIGPKEDVERLLKLIRALEEELRLLRAKTESKEAAPAPRKVEGTTTTVERQLLMLDVKEAELEEAAAREAYLAARQLKSTDATSAAEVEDRLAAWRKAKIWLERARLRAELGERPQAAVTFTDATDDAAGNAASLAEKLRQLEAEEAQLDFEAAKQAYGLGLKMHADGVLSSTALAARKLRFQKAVIAKERMELRLKSVQPPAADLKNQSSQSDRRVETIEMQNANIESLELQLKAARNQLNSQRTFFLNAFNRETTPHPNGFTDGFQFSMPLGLRHSLSQIRNTELRLAQAKNMLATQLIESGNGE
jgi:hypothetical protein